ncbi:MAG: hypothetical protein ACK4YP_23450, partial [Myxococcota bacterium]
HHWWDGPEEETAADAKKDGKKGAPPSAAPDTTPEKVARDERAAEHARERVEEREKAEDVGVRAVHAVNVRTERGDAAPKKGKKP